MYLYEARRKKLNKFLKIATVNIIPCKARTDPGFCVKGEAIRRGVWGPGRDTKGRDLLEADGFSLLLELFGRNFEAF